MAEWDDDNFEPGDLQGGGLSNKWEGEDEDDEVKENWEDEEEEKKVVEEAAEIKPKPKKKLVDKIAEKEKQKKEELERRVREQQEEDISPEEQLRREKESDLKLALETTFGGSNKSSGVDGFPTNKEEFQEWAETLTKNIQQFAKNEDYPVFAENLVRGICAALNSFDLKKIKTTIDNMYLEKQKIEKGDKAKKNKGKGKAKLKMEGDNLNQYSAYVDDFDDFNDFM